MIRAAPYYTTREAVLAELPPGVTGPSSPLTDAFIELKLQETANHIDSMLSAHYVLPAPALSPQGPCNTGFPDGTTLMPTLLEQINRFLTAEECLVRLRDMRNDEQSNKAWYRDQAMELLEKIRTGDVWLIYPFKDCATRQPVYVELVSTSPLFSKHPLMASKRIRMAYPKREFTRESWPFKAHPRSSDE